MSEINLNNPESPAVIIRELDSDEDVFPLPINPILTARW